MLYSTWAYVDLSGDLPRRLPSLGSGVVRVEPHPAFVLHKRLYRETSLLLEVLSSKYGRVGLVAKGARRRQDKQRLLQPFYPLRVAWSGRGELFTLIGAEADGPACLFMGHQLPCAFYINEIVLRLLHRHDPYPELYAMYHRTLTRLSGADNAEPVLRQFEKGLLDELGYGLILDHDVETGEAVKDEQAYFYCNGRGPSRARGSSHPSVVVHGATLKAIAEDNYQSTEDIKEAKRLMRFVLQPLLGDKPLASKRLFR